MGNLVLNKSATASSYMKPYSSSRAVDGSVKPVQRWVSGQVPAWLSVNLQGQYWINRWIVRHMGAAGWTSPYYNLSNFKLQRSLDGVNWFDIDVVTNNTLSVTDRTFTAVQAVFVRVYITGGIAINPKLVSIAEFEVYDAPPTSPYLSGLTLSSGSLQPTFVKNNYSYSTTVSNSTASITITPTAEDPGATIKINGVVVPSGTASGAINLNVGNNAIPVQVTSKIGGLVINYMVNVTRQKSVNLSNLTTSAGTLSPAFNTDTTSYTVNVPYDTTSITVTPTAEDNTAAITVNSQSVVSGQASQAINLNIGDNTVTVVVSADGEQKTYSMVVTRPAYSTFLTGLIVKAGKGTLILNPAFVETELNYTTSTSSTAASVIIIPTSEFPSNVDIVIGGLVVPSGSSSNNIALTGSSTDIPVVVQSKTDSSIKTTYKITVNK